MEALLLILTPFILTLLSVYYLSKRKFEYWKKKNVPYLKPAPFLGNYRDYILLKKSWGKVTQDICKKFPDAPYVGAYYGTEPTLIVKDPEFIKLVITKDFYYFSGREISKYINKETINRHLFSIDGDTWKVLRQNMTPLFSSAKMRKMFRLIEICTYEFENLLDSESSQSDVIEVRALMARFTMDCIGACAFGVDTKVMGDQSKKNPFRLTGDTIFEISSFRALKLIARSIWPSVFYGLGLKAMPRNVEDFFRNMLTQVFEGRQYKPSERNDFVDLTLSLKKNNYITGDSLSNMKMSNGKKINLKVDDDLLIAQCFVFFAAGFETSSTTLSYTLYELAKDEEAQRKALEEVDSYLRRQKNKLTYDCVSELSYLEACVDEALRLYPVLSVVTREVMEDYTLPTGVRLDKGIRIHLPVYHLHHNPDFFPEPEKFRPERFLAEEKQNVKPYTYIPFGDGPRVCIGMRFAKMQMLAGLVTLLKKYRVELADGMPRTLEFEPKSIVTQPIGAIKLKFIPRSGWEQRVFVHQE